jgi:hypothetical protein
MVIAIPPGWTQSAPTHDETTLISIQAPSRYNYVPTTLQVQSRIGYFPKTSPEEAVNKYFGRPDMGIVKSCGVNSDGAAYFPFTDGAQIGFEVVWLHFNYAYSVTLQGNGGLDSRSIQDTKGVLASVRWTVQTPPSPVR